MSCVTIDSKLNWQTNRQTKKDRQTDRHRHTEKHTHAQIHTHTETARSVDCTLKKELFFNFEGCDYELESLTKTNFAKLSS